MPITKKSPTVQTRLESKDFLRFVARAKSEKLTQSKLARKAIHAYLLVDDPEKQAEQDRIIEKLSSEVNRLAAMITSVRNDVMGTQVDVHIMYLFFKDWIKDENLLLHYVEEAPKKIKERRAKYKERKQQRSGADDT
ncbi:MAG: hypothetical protein K2W95_12230 [Candidatus Obscuribacterales bacterium]|nr:hypothetical protein [Candidatus Obscuribacterales bacterium]